MRTRNSELRTQNYNPKELESKWPFGKAQGKQDYDPGVIEPKWQRAWEKHCLYQPDIKKSRKPFFNLMMFPYPSALGLHVGNIYAFVGSDIYGRFKRMQGLDVFEPIGLDGFGIHSENFALKVGKHPMDLSKKTESNIYAQLHTIGNGFAWSHKLETYISDYYKWTQWIFIQLYKKGLAYRAKASVNWCPGCLTVLADEQVISRQLGNWDTGKLGQEKPRNPETQKPRNQIYVCERCGTEVEKRELEQWFFRITDYAQRLLSGLEKIDWSEKVKIAQRNWLGKSEGLLLKFESDIESNTSVDVFTTRPDTLYGVTFMALAPEHPLVIKILDKSKGLLRRQIQKYVADSIKKPEAERIGLVGGEKQKDSALVKTGIKTPFHCTNPASGKQLPIFVADYVVMSYGTGAVMGVPAHDQRDYLFAKKYQIDIVEVIKPAGPAQKIPNSKIQNPNLEKDVASNASPERSRRISQEAFTEYGVLVNSGEFNGLNSQEAIKVISGYAVKKGFGEKKVMWHLRDWIISRQRYWGAPIPMIFCDKCAQDGESWFTTEEAKKYQVSTFSFRKASIKHQVRENEKIPNTKYLIQNTAAMRGWYPVPESDLPVELPYIKNFKPTHSTSSGQAGMGPLGRHPEFYLVKCPECGSEARRETDVSDTFLDSAWYFLRYPSVNEENSKLQTPNSKKLGFGDWELGIPWNREVTRRWLPVDMYIGGAEHSVLHLLYSRFLTMAFYDMDLVDFTEPFSKFRAHGLLIKEGGKMSKSKGNVVLPDPYIEKFGADTLRTYLMFCGRFDQGGDFRDTGIEGMSKFLKRIWRLAIGQLGNWAVGQVGKSEPKNLIAQDPNSLYLMHKTIKKVSEDVENLRYNTAISAIMEWVGTLEKRVSAGPVSSFPPAPSINSGQAVLRVYPERSRRTVGNPSTAATRQSGVTRDEVENLLLLLAPFAPHMTEELWQRLEVAKVSKGTKGTKASDTSDTFDTFDTFDSIHIYPWPKYDPKLATAQKIELVVEVNGKVRDRIVVDRGIEKEDAQKAALDLKNTQKYISGKKPNKIIFVKDRLINIVV